VQQAAFAMFMGGKAYGMPDLRTFPQPSRLGRRISWACRALKLAASKLTSRARAGQPEHLRGNRLQGAQQFAIGWVTSGTSGRPSST